MGIDLGKTATKAASNPLGAAKDLVAGVLGIGGPTTAELRNRSYSDVHAKIRAGNYPALANAVANSRWLGARWEALWAIRNRSRDANAAEQARRAAGVPRDVHPSENLQLTGELVGALAGENVWADTTGTAPAAEPSSLPSTPVPLPSAPSAPKARPSAPKQKAAPAPCAAGKERNPATGRCRNIPPLSSGPLGIAGAAERPCSYGPRGPDGKCPQKPCTYGPRVDGRCPSKPPRTVAEEVKAAVLNKAMTAGGNVAVAAYKGAIQAVKAGLAAGGISAGAAASTAASVLAAVAAAALVGWTIGSTIRDAGELKEQRRANAGIDRQHAVAALRETLGRQPTLEEQRPITDAYNRRLTLIATGLA